jgi:hypothetical protein
MEPLLLEEDIKTPSISFEPASGILEIKGKSIPENSLEFYRPVFDWLDQYCAEPSKSTELRIILDYFNTSSSKCLLDILRKLETANTSGNTVVKVKWHYESDDEDMMEAGEDYQALVKLPFELVKTG